MICADNLQAFATLTVCGVLGAVGAVVLYAVFALHVARREGRNRRKAWREREYGDPIPVIRPYPKDFELRRVLVLKDIHDARLTEDEARAFVQDGTITVNEFRTARAELRFQG